MLDDHESNSDHDQDDLTKDDDDIDDEQDEDMNNQLDSLEKTLRQIEKKDTILKQKASQITESYKKISPKLNQTVDKLDDDTQHQINYQTENQNQLQSEMNKLSNDRIDTLVISHDDDSNESDNFSEDNYDDSFGSENETSGDKKPDTESINPKKTTTSKTETNELSYSDIEIEEELDDDDDDIVEESDNFDFSQASSMVDNPYAAKDVMKVINTDDIKKSLTAEKQSEKSKHSIVNDTKSHDQQLDKNDQIVDEEYNLETIADVIVSVTDQHVSIPSKIS